MPRVSRFTWVDWAKGRLLLDESFQGYPCWIGEQDGYKRLKDPVSQRRAVINLGEDRWFVLDWLMGNQNHHYRLHWLLADFPHAKNDLENSIVLKAAGSRAQVQVGIMDGEGIFSVVIADPNSTRGWRSRYYGEKEPALSLALEKDARPGLFLDVRWTRIRRGFYYPAFNRDQAFENPARTWKTRLLRKSKTRQISNTLGKVTKNTLGGDGFPCIIVWQSTQRESE